MATKTLYVTCGGVWAPVHTFQTLVIGSGCAALNGADSLYDLGHRDMALVTEGMNMGTSRNTGSDKQTYYKLSLSSSTPDSVFDMARALYDGQSVHGDTALVEAALSARCFFKLVGLGVPFPFDCYGQYVGYKTDHDPMKRGTSCGPLTSRHMTECLERSVRSKEIPIFDGYRVIELLTEGEGENRHIAGALAVSGKVKENPYGLVLFHCRNILYATGGPSGIYHNSVYPPSQTCSHGAAFMAGVKGSNLTEWQYGIASTGFRWNLSGTYQQVIPRYVSTAQDGSDAREFLQEYFDSPGQMLTAVFLKGYQWPFDPRKLMAGGSSLVDIAVYIETMERGRRVFLDYRENPREAGENGEFDFSNLTEEARGYLENSGALFGTPVERLKKMNAPAYELYVSHGIDLEREMLEISVCSQHNNGGLKADLWWQSDLKGFFPVGEVCGNFGVYRPGGSALNATQVGALRAAQYISERGNGGRVDFEEYARLAAPVIERTMEICCRLCTPGPEKLKPFILREKYQREMDCCAGFIRRKEGIRVQKERCRLYLKQFAEQTFAEDHAQLKAAFINRDILITQFVYLSAMEQYIAEGGKSRGSYLIDDGSIDYSHCREWGITLKLDEGERAEFVQEAELLPDGTVAVELVRRRPLPADDKWFETIYNDFLNHRIIGMHG